MLTSIRVARFRITSEIHDYCKGDRLEPMVSSLHGTPDDMYDDDRRCIIDIIRLDI